MTDDPNRNPGWVRPADWTFPEDWNSPAWKERMAATYKERAEKRRAFGFTTCPQCGQEHTALTLTCRNCEFMAGR